MKGSKTIPPRIVLPVSFTESVLKSALGVLQRSADIPPDLEPVFGRVLRTWAELDLPEYAAACETRSDLISSRSPVGAFLELASKMSSAMREIEQSGHFDILALAIQHPRAIRAEDQSSAETREALRALKRNLPRWVHNGREFQQLTKARPGNPRNSTADRVLLDIVDIYEAFTGDPASRKFDRIDGIETGTFYRFAETVWSVVFGNGANGLPAAIRRWEPERSINQGVLIANMKLRGVL